MVWGMFLWRMFEIDCSRTRESQPESVAKNLAGIV